MAYITLAEFKTHLGIDIADTSKDDLLNSILEDVTGIIDSYIGQTLPITNYEDVFVVKPGLFNNLFVLKHTPVVSVSAVLVNGNTVNGDLYYLYKSQGKIVVSGVSVGDEVIVRYTAGYSNIPNEIKYVSKVLGAKLYSIASTGGTIQSERVGDWSIDYKSDASKDLLDMEVRNILDKFKRPVI